MYTTLAAQPLLWLEVKKTGRARYPSTVDVYKHYAGCILIALFICHMLDGFKQATTICGDVNLS
jgi:hypothetical protein